MPGIFDSILTKTTSDLALLSIFHTTQDNKKNHENILAKKILKVSDCPVYKEPLLYLFYGRPAYKIPAPHYPMCFVFKFDDSDLSNIRRKMAFDSGAFYYKRMDKFFPSGAKLEDFEIANLPMEFLQRFIKIFFNNNSNYFDSIVNNPLPEFQNDLLKSYVSLIQSPDQESLDDRRKSLEIQFGSAFDLSTKKPEILIISSAHIENEEERINLEQELGCLVKIIDQNRSCDFNLEIHGLVRSHFEQKAFL